MPGPGLELRTLSYKVDVQTTTLPLETFIDITAQRYGSSLFAFVNSLNVQYVIEQPLAGCQI